MSIAGKAYDVLEFPMDQRFADYRRQTQPCDASLFGCRDDLCSQTGFHRNMRSFLELVAAKYTIRVTEVRGLYVDVAEPTASMFGRCEQPPNPPDNHQGPESHTHPGESHAGLGAHVGKLA
jgi:hypothetical protein